MTADGMQPVDWLRAGDRVMTRDRGFQRVIWADRTVVPASPDSPQQIRLSAGCVGRNIPEQDFNLHPDHRILLKSPQIDLLFGDPEALVAVNATANGRKITETQPTFEVSYFHILFGQHEIVQAEGLWVESFFPDRAALKALSAEQQTCIRQRLGSKLDNMQTARHCLNSPETNLLIPQKRQGINQQLSVA